VQTRDKWGFQMTARPELYAELLGRYVSPNFVPQIIRDPSLPQSGAAVGSGSAGQHTQVDDPKFPKLPC
jgi:hypothetical protein